MLNEIISDSRYFDFFLGVLIGALILAVTLYIIISYKCIVEEIILTDNAGILLVHNSRGKAWVTDATLVAGQFIAVQGFIKDSFGRGNKEIDENWQEFISGDIRIVAVKGKYTTLYGRISGQSSKRLRNRMRYVVEEFEARYSFVLADWDGDMAKFEGAKEIVGKLFGRHFNRDTYLEKSKEEMPEFWEVLPPPPDRMKPKELPPPPEKAYPTTLSTATPQKHIAPKHEGLPPQLDKVQTKVLPPPQEQIHLKSTYKDLLPPSDDLPPPIDMDNWKPELYELRLAVALVGRPKLRFPKRLCESCRKWLTQGSLQESTSKTLISREKEAHINGDKHNLDTVFCEPEDVPEEVCI